MFLKQLAKIIPMRHGTVVFLSQIIEFLGLIPFQNLEDSFFFVFITILSLNVYIFRVVELNLTLFENEALLLVSPKGVLEFR